MASATILAPDMSMQALKGPQLLKAPLLAAGIETALTNVQLSQNLNDVNFTESTIHFLDVQAFDAFEIGVWATASSNDSIAFNMYGWNSYGHGYLIGTETVIFCSGGSAASTGWHAQVGKTHKSITDAFAAGTAYVGCDSYVDSVDVYSIITPPTITTSDMPTTIFVNASNKSLVYFGVVVTNVTVVGTPTNIGFVWKAITQRSSGTYPDGF